MKDAIIKSIESMVLVISPLRATIIKANERNDDFFQSINFSGYDEILVMPIKDEGLADQRNKLINKLLKKIEMLLDQADHTPEIKTKVLGQLNAKAQVLFNAALSLTTLNMAYLQEGTKEYKSFDTNRRLLSKLMFKSPETVGLVKDVRAFIEAEAKVFDQSSGSHSLK